MTTDARGDDDPPAFTDGQLRLLADSLPQLVWTANDAGEVDYYNSKVADYGGWTEEAGSYAWQPLIHAEDLEVTVAAWSTATAERREYEFEHRLLMADGSYRWHLSRALPLRDSDGAVVKWFGTATDIHERRLTQVRLETTAHVLQEALLPAHLPSVAGMQFAARYQPAAQDQEVGGDWFDVVATPDCVVLVIGDVAGHGIESAAAMGAARHAVATTAQDGAEPSACLATANRYLAGLGHDFVTCCVVALDREARRLRVATAGHPPPFVDIDGAFRLLQVRPGLPLGADRSAQYGEATETHPVQRVVLYTDGLIERRGRDIDAGLALLQRTLADLSRVGIDDLCDELMARLAGDARDDVAVLVACLD